MADDPPVPPFAPAPAPVRRVVVVLGMHRSGTSAVAGCLQRLGVDFGPRLMPATEDNARGYFEHIDLVNLHDRLLLALGRGWDDTAPFPVDWWQNDALTGRYRAEALGLLRRDFSAAPLWGFKDPRLCRLLPWWESLWRETRSVPLFVLVRRPPSEVAASLARREEFSQAKSHLLWLQHTIEAERATRRHARVFVDFKAFLADWHAALEPVGAALGQPWPVPPPRDEPADGRFVDPALVRAGRAGAVSERLPQWVEEADAALQLGPTAREGEMRVELDRIAGCLHAAESLYAPLPAAVTADLRHQLGAVRRQALWYEAEWHKARTRGDAARERLLAKQQEVQRLRGTNPDNAN